MPFRDRNTKVANIAYLKVKGFTLRYHIAIKKRKSGWRQ
jgi:hypothetical protein